MTELARHAGIRKTPLASKIKRETSLTNEESVLVHRALRDAGLILCAEIVKAKHLEYRSPLDGELFGSCTTDASGPVPISPISDCAPALSKLGYPGT